MRQPHPLGVAMRLTQRSSRYRISSGVAQALNGECVVRRSSKMSIILATGANRTGKTLLSASLWRMLTTTGKVIVLPIDGNPAPNSCAMPRAGESTLEQMEKDGCFGFICAYSESHFRIFLKTSPIIKT